MDTSRTQQPPNLLTSTSFPNWPFSIATIPTLPAKVICLHIIDHLPKVRLKNNAFLQQHVKMPAKRARSGDNAESAELSRSPRAARASRPDLSGLDLDPEAADDEEYSAHDEDEEGDDSMVKDDEDASDRKRRKKTVPESDEDGASDENDEDEGENGAENEEENLENNAKKDPKEEPAEDTDTVEKVAVVRKVPKKRGRKKLKLVDTGEGYLDEEGNPINVDGDEVVIDEEDPKGKEKIDSNGFLKGGRRFRMKTFTVLGKGEKQFMVSTEPARLVGFRDSYLLFKTHRSLFKLVCDNDEKMDLIDRHIIPNSYKGRSVNLVAARSIFREFGAQVLVDGRKVTDDFWEQRAIDNGDIAGEYADPEISRNRIANLLNGEAGSSQAPTPVAGVALVNYQADPTWMYQISTQTKVYNDILRDQREQVWQRGIKDVYGGYNFYPTGSQPTKTRFARFKGADHGKLTFDSRFSNPNIRRRNVGLASVPKHIFDDVDEDTKRAILEQQEYERLL